MAQKYFDRVDWTENLKIASGSITHTATDTKTTIKKSSAISLSDTVSCINPTNKYMLYLQRPINDTANNMVGYVYNVDKIDGTNARDILIDTTTVAEISATTSYKAKVVEGLFLGSAKQIKIGVSYPVSTTSALTAYYNLYRL